MLRNVREEIRMLDLLGKGIFYQPGLYRYNALRSLAFGAAAAYFGLFITLGVGVGLVYYLIIATMFILPSVSVLHPLYGAHQDKSWRNNWDLRHEGQFYRGLSKEDKALYPHNIIKVITDPDLDDSQAQIIDGRMEKLRHSIEDRNKQRRLAVKRHLDISSILEVMEDSKAGVEIETNTIKEFM